MASLGRTNDSRSGGSVKYIMTPGTVDKSMSQDAEKNIDNVRPQQLTSCGLPVFPILPGKMCQAPFVFALVLIWFVTPLVAAADHVLRVAASSVELPVAVELPAGTTADPASAWRLVQDGSDVVRSGPDRCRDLGRRHAGRGSTAAVGGGSAGR